MKRFLSLLMAAAILLSCFTAFGESALVITPGGKLNVRKTASTKGKMAGSVPNHTWVELTEAGEEWSQISWDGKSGYVKNEYLVPESSMIGKTIYPDVSTLPVRETASDEASICAVLGSADSLTIESVENGWARITTVYGTEGYVPADQVAHLYTDATAAMTWYARAGVMIKDQDVMASVGKKAGKTGAVAAGDAVTITAFDKNYALIIADACCGYVPTASVQIIPEESGLEADAYIAAACQEAANNALRKAYKAFAKATLYPMITQLDVTGAARYEIAYTDSEGRILYGALTNKKSSVLCVADYRGFGFQGTIQSKGLPMGEINVSLSTENAAVGDVIDITAEVWAEATCRYNLYLGETCLVEGKPSQYRNAAYRPRKEGSYTIEVIAEDKDKHTASSKVYFQVSGNADDKIPAVYSQKDGWWADKAYRKSDLMQSGCAIFALSHALHRLGHTEDSTLPEALAKTHALCLTTTGTNNHRLLTEAASTYGFKTQKALITKKGSIVSLLKEGAMFSFSVARGHIALIDGISDDGTMVHVVDSAPTATIERIKSTAIYIQTTSGSFTPVKNLSEVPGARWYFETEHFGGLEYWMPLSYASKRGVRLIQPNTGK